MEFNEGELKGGKLIGEGSSTCVFKPNLPCSNNTTINNNIITKLFLKKEKDINKEINFNIKISRLKNSNQWSVVLYNKCFSPDYKTLLKHDKDINLCLNSNNMNQYNFNSDKYLMLYGDYGGINLNEYTMQITNKLNNVTILNGFLKLLISLFYGLHIMSINNIYFTFPKGFRV